MAKIKKEELATLQSKVWTRPGNYFAYYIGLLEKHGCSPTTHKIDMMTGNILAIPK